MQRPLKSNTGKYEQRWYEPEQRASFLVFGCTKGTQNYDWIQSVTAKK